MSFKDNYPLTPPTLSLDFVNSATVDPRVTFSRSSKATYYNPAGLLTVADVNVPRIDYDPITHECKGLLIEEARTNLLTYSSEFDNTAWVKTNATVTNNAVISPDGTTTGDTVLAVATGGDTGVRYTTTQVGGTLYTASIYAKYTNTRYLVIRNLAIGATLGDQWTFFDLLNGTIGTKPAGVTAVITPVSGGWYRCSVSATTLATIANNFLDYRCSITDDAYSVLNTSTINIWGAQLEAGSFPTSYIPTTSAQVTRTADNASMVGTNFSSWYNQSEGTVLCFSTCLGQVSNFPTVWWADDSTLANYLGQYYYTNIMGVAQRANSINYGDIVTVGSSINPLVINKSAYSYKTNDSALSVNGSALTGMAVDNTLTLPTLSRFNIGAKVGAQYLNGHIQSFKYYPTRLTNAQLQTLTNP